MKMTRILVQVPAPLKTKLDALRSQGYSVSAYIRNLLQRELKHAPAGRKGR